MSEENNNQYDPILNEKLTNHNYDGIKELDNPLPRWWVQGFYLTIIFSLAYVFYFHVFDKGSIEKEYQQDMAELLDKNAAETAQEETLSTEEIEKKLKSPEVLALGKTEFKTKCLSCHGANGEGGIGPNLTDAYWIHGDGTFLTTLKTVQEGVAAKGMPPWKALMKKDEIVAVTAYVLSLKGTRPSNAKAPQGEKVE